MGRYSRRRILENSAGISIRDLLNSGYLKKLSIGVSTLTLTRSHQSGILATVEMKVQVTSRDRFSEENYIQFSINGESAIRHSIETIPCHLGGYRFYFRCSCYKNKAYCGKRVKSLYFGGHIYACRHCLDLSYQQARDHRSFMYASHITDKLMKRADNLRQTGHPRLANRLYIKAEKYRQLSNAIFTNYASKLRSKYNR